MSEIGILLASYLVGAIPFSLLVGWWTRGVDVRLAGSGNPGATNLLRVAGVLPALLALLLDLGKGAFPVLAASRAGLPAAFIGFVAAAAVAGHVFPPYLAFRGGKGVATAVGALAPIAPGAVAGAIGLFGLVVAWTRWVSLGSLALVGSVPIFGVLLPRVGWAESLEAPILFAAVAVAAIVITRHAENIRRLLAGTERRLGDEVASR